MSLAEVHTAARALPRDERLELVRSLNAELTPEPDPSEIPEHLRHLIPSPGTVIDIWLPDTDEAGWEQIRLAFEEIERQR